MMLARAFHYSFITAKKGALGTLSLGRSLFWFFFWDVSVLEARQMLADGHRGGAKLLR